MILSDVDKVILNLLKKTGKPLSTYQIAKKAKVTWPTANSHCYKLKSMNLVESKQEKSKFGPNEKVVWWAL
jgi:Mn-dependent DtxR family transcriptional regulator